MKTAHTAAGPSVVTDPTAPLRESVVDSAADYMPVLDLLTRDGPGQAPVPRAVVALVMAQAVAWQARGTALTVGEALDQAHTDWNDLETCADACGGDPVVLTRLHEALGQLDHPPLRLAQYERLWAAPEPVGWADPTFLYWLVDSTAPRCARFVARIAPMGWRVAPGPRPWSCQSVHGPMQKRALKCVELCGRGLEHPTVVALAHGRWDVAAALDESRPLETPEDRDAALHAVAAAVHDPFVTPANDLDRHLRQAAAWVRALVDRGADPHRGLTYRLNAAPEQPVLLRAPVEGMTVETFARPLLRGKGWRETGRAPRAALVHARTDATVMVVSASDWAVRSAGRLTEAADPEAVAAWLDGWRAAWALRGGPRPAWGWFSSGATMLLHAVAPGVGTEPVARAALAAWLPACVDADAAAWAPPWWTDIPRGQQPWDAWGVAANLATHPIHHPKGAVLLEELLNTLPAGVALPVAAGQRLAGLLVDGIDWSTHVGHVHAVTIRDLIRMMDTQTARDPSSTAFPEAAPWAQAIDTTVRAAFARMAAPHAAAALAWLEQVRTETTTMERRSDETVQRVRDRAALLWTVLVEGAVDAAPPRENRAGRLM